MIRLDDPSVSQRRLSISNYLLLTLMEAWIWQEEVERLVY